MQAELSCSVQSACSTSKLMFNTNQNIFEILVELFLAIYSHNYFGKYWKLEFCGISSHLHPSTESDQMERDLSALYLLSPEGPVAEMTHTNK